MKKFSLLLALSAAVWAAPLICSGQETPKPQSSERECSESITWEKTVIIYNKSLGRDCALKLQSRLEPLIGHKIALYPCEKEGGMNDWPPQNATRIVIGNKYYYGFPHQPKEMGEKDWFSIRIGKTRPRKSARGAYPGDIEIKTGKEGADKAFESLVEYLKPFVKDGRLTPVPSSCFRKWDSSGNK